MEPAQEKRSSKTPDAGPQHRSWHRAFAAAKAVVDRDLVVFKWVDAGSFITICLLSSHCREVTAWEDAVLHIAGPKVV